MKSFYGFVFLIGIGLVIFMQVVTFATPRDALVASVLARSPASWDINLDSGLKSRLAHYDVKAEMVTALEKRRASCDEIYSQSFFVAVGLMFFSAVGLVRERKIDRVRRIIEPA